MCRRPESFNHRIHVTGTTYFSGVAKTNELSDSFCRHKNGIGSYIQVQHAVMVHTIQTPTDPYRKLQRLVDRILFEQGG